MLRAKALLMRVVTAGRMVTAMAAMRLVPAAAAVLAIRQQSQQRQQQQLDNNMTTNMTTNRTSNMTTNMEEGGAAGHSGKWIAQHTVF